MKMTQLAVAAAFALTATGVLAETGVKIGQVDNVANVYGRAGIPNVRTTGPVVTRPSDEVASGATTVAGSKAEETVAEGANVNSVYGRS